MKIWIKGGERERENERTLSNKILLRRVPEAVFRLTDSPKWLKTCNSLNFTSSDYFDPFNNSKIYGRLKARQLSVLDSVMVIQSLSGDYLL